MANVGERELSAAAKGAADCGGAEWKGATGDYGAMPVVSRVWTGESASEGSRAGSLAGRDGEGGGCGITRSTPWIRSSLLGCL